MKESRFKIYMCVLLMLAFCGGVFARGVGPAPLPAAEVGAKAEPAPSDGADDAPDTPRWLELPRMTMPDNCITVTHFTEIGQLQVRNYTICYDTVARISYWVAYPLHKLYLGGGKRSDSWKYDPLVGREYQVNVSRSFGGGYDRGHQIPSADRSVTREANGQTFYATNVTPQRSAFNQRVWNRLEAKLRKALGEDTIYIVSGAVLGGEASVRPLSYSSDGAQRNTPSCPAGGDQEKGAPYSSVGGAAVPDFYFKVVLYSRGQELRTIGFWYDHSADYPAVPSPAQACIVAEIEKLTGFDFFANLPDEVQRCIENEYFPEDWF